MVLLVGLEIRRAIACIKVDLPFQVFKLSFPLPIYGIVHLLTGQTAFSDSKHTFYLTSTQFLIVNVFFLVYCYATSPTLKAALSVLNLKFSNVSRGFLYLSRRL